MKWYTREGAKTDRIACPWFIKRFVDQDAIFVFLPKDKVVETARAAGGKSFDCPGADYTHVGEDCSFESLIKAFDHHSKHPGITELAAIVHSADVDTPEPHPLFRPEGIGLLAMAEGFAITTRDDHEKLRLQFPVYDALLAYCASKQSRKAEK